VNGLIRSKEVLANLPLIWREYGSACALRCLKAVALREKTTFLDVALGGTLQAPPLPARRKPEA
jgi:hypothetical protein